MKLSAEQHNRIIDIIASGVVAGVVVQLTPGQDPTFLPHWRSDPERIG